VSYLVPAYVFAALGLGGYLAWSLVQLRDLIRHRD
jgi:hypothetical protein